MSRIDQLKDLERMFEKGLITRDEFDTEKATLFGSKPGPMAPSTVGRDETIGAYRIIEVIGRGGMGTVYRARHTVEEKAKSQGGDIALKLLHPQLVESGSYIKRFEKEAALGLKLNHSGIVKVHDLVRDGEHVALVMELVHGKELSTFIGEERGPIPWAEAQHLFFQILDAVGFAHEQGVIHRDLKPENIIITLNNQVKILDFGIAKELGKGTTRTGIGMGTLYYMAPEQHQNAKDVDARADIYALGMTLYEMLSGCLPWDDDVGEFDIISAKVHGKIPPPTKFYPYIPAQVVVSVESALSAEIDTRIGSCHQFRRDLSFQVEKERQTPSRQVERPPKESNSDVDEVQPKEPPVLAEQQARSDMMGGFLVPIVMIVALFWLLRMLLGFSAS